MARKNIKEKYQTLTKGEMEVMKRVWKQGGPVCVKNVLEAYDQPLPAYTTIATYMKILTAKGFLTEERQDGGGRTLFYKPTLSQDDYTRRVMADVKTDLFGGSVKSLVSFFVREENISKEEMEELLKLIGK